MIDSEKKYRIGLSFFEGIGPLRFQALFDYFGSSESIYRAEKQELIATNIGTALVERFVRFRESFDLSSFVGQIEKQNIHVISKTDRQYPETLRHLSDCPFLLYALGDYSLLSSPRLFGVVGTRTPTRYGVSVTQQFTGELVQCGFVIVSGMAMGVDAIAHTAALDASGTTIAVLGCGVDICYPAVNRSLYDRIKKKGLIVSEFPPGKRTSRGVFPSRNRIVAGVSRGILVTEGAVKSGSLITARYASEYGRDVFAVPGPVGSTMSGAPLMLIQNGAKAVGSIRDILSEFEDAGIYPIHQAPTKDLMAKLSNPEKQIVLLLTGEGSLHIDEIARRIHLSTSDVLAYISTLEMGGVIKEVGQEVYAVS